MNPIDLQAHRKRRLKDAIDRFFEGKNVNLARRLRNKDGQPLKDGSYVGHLLLEIGKKGARPIDEDRIREIESLRPELVGWFALGGLQGELPEEFLKPQARITASEAIHRLAACLMGASESSRDAAATLLSRLAHSPGSAADIAETFTRLVGVDEGQAAPAQVQKGSQLWNYVDTPGPNVGESPPIRILPSQRADKKGEQ